MWHGNTLTTVGKRSGLEGISRQFWEKEKCRGYWLSVISYLGKTCIHRREAESAEEGVLFFLSVDPRGIGSAFHRDDRKEKTTSFGGCGKCIRLGMGMKWR